MIQFRVVSVLAMTLAAAVAPLWAQTMTYEDPTGDDNGPGRYSYPTDPVYLPGSFDLTRLEINVTGGKAEFKASVNSLLRDPQRGGAGFAVQMILVFIDTDGKAGSGHTDGVPGINVKFAEGNEWDKCIILSPQSPTRVTREIRTKARDMADDIIVPSQVSGSGKVISASIRTEEIGGRPTTWGVQVVMQSNEGSPAKTDLLTRKVNEVESQHRFGGGTDYDCDPHVMDILAGEAKGAASEVRAQHAMLAYECDDDGNATKMATLKMIRR